MRIIMATLENLEVGTDTFFPLPLFLLAYFQLSTFLSPVLKNLPHIFFLFLSSFCLQTG